MRHEFDDYSDRQKVQLVQEGCAVMVRELRRMAHAEGGYAAFRTLPDEVKLIWISAARTLEDFIVNAKQAQ